MRLFAAVGLGLGLREREAVGGRVGVVREEPRGGGHGVRGLVLAEGLRGRGALRSPSSQRPDPRGYPH